VRLPLNFTSDDGIVVVPHPQQRRLPFHAIMPSRTTPDPLKPRDILADLREFDRRRDIIEEHLRRRIARDGTLRRRDPTEWKDREKGRLARNRETAAINRRLRAEGLRPIELEPSFERRVKKLQQLEAPNRARTATRKTRS
jgi:hypothetical protein